MTTPYQRLHLRENPLKKDTVACMDPQASKLEPMAHNRLTQLPLVSVLAGSAAIGLSGWMAVMRFAPEFGGIRKENLSRWLALDSAELITLVGLTIDASTHPKRAHRWAIASTLLVLSDAVADVYGARPGRERKRAIAMAAAIEVPSAIALASWTTHRLIRRHRNS